MAQIEISDKSYETLLDLYKDRADILEDDDYFDFDSQEADKKIAELDRRISGLICYALEAVKP